MSRARSSGMNLSRTQTRQLVTLIGHLQDYLESEIESHTLRDGSIPVNDKTAVAIVGAARRDWKRAEQWVKLLSGSSVASTERTPPTAALSDYIGGSATGSQTKKRKRPQKVSE